MCNKMEDQKAFYEKVSNWCGCDKKNVELQKTLDRIRDVAQLVIAAGEGQPKDSELYHYRIMGLKLMSVLDENKSNLSTGHNGN